MVKRFGDNVVSSKGEVFDTIGSQDGMFHILSGEFGQGVYRSTFHGFIDHGGAYVKGSSEDKWKAEHVVDLVGEVGSSGGHDDVAACIDGDRPTSTSASFAASSSEQAGVSAAKGSL
jgi:hypothetical protein